EAALGPVDLHRRDAEVEQDRIGLDAVLSELLEHDREVAAQEPRLGAGALREAVEERARAGIAVDRDQLAALAEIRREQRGVAAGAEGGVDDRLSGCTARSSRTSSGRTGTWSVALVCKTFGNIFRTPFDFGQFFAPGGAVPD